MDRFRLNSEFKPKGDQPQAIEKLVAGLNDGERAQVLLGVTGSGKTFTIANVIQAVAHALKSVPGGKGMGFFYWQPDFIPVQGAGWKYGEGCEWDDQTMFDFTGHALWSLDVLKMHGR